MTAQRQITVAEHAGFCFGVRRAIAKAEKAAEEGKPVCSMGSLIHNDRVATDLQEKGVRIIERLEEAEPGERVIIRSHGEGRAV